MSQPRTTLNFSLTKKDIKFLNSKSFLSGFFTKIKLRIFPKIVTSVTPFHFFRKINCKLKTTPSSVTFNHKKFFLLFDSYSLVLSAHSTSTVNTVMVRIRLLGPLWHDVWPPYPLGISSFGPSFHSIIRKIATRVHWSSVVHLLCTSFSEHT